jgi:hypothetical protein
MNWFKKIFLKLAECLHPSYKTEHTDDIPKSLSKRTIYIVGKKNEPWLLTFECPCGCKNIIQLNTLKEARPRWNYQILPQNKLDISPSIWRLSGCKSHFFVRKGKIIWC